jgi:hypothetical protein
VCILATANIRIGGKSVSGVTILMLHSATSCCRTARAALRG